MTRIPVLIALVGEQPTPNLIPLYPLPGQAPFQVVQYMVSGDPRTRKVADNLSRAIQADEQLKETRQAALLPLDAWDLAKAREDMRAAFERYPQDQDEVTVSLTGGTKIMSLAAYLEAKQAGLPALYVNTERGELIRFDQNGVAQPPEALRVRVPIATQLEASGHPITSAKKPSDLPRERVALAKTLIDRYNPLFTALIVPLVRALAGQSLANPLKLDVPADCASFVQALETNGLLKWNRAASEVRVRDGEAKGFLEGGWLEYYCLAALDESGYFDEVLGNVMMQDIPGEVDCMVSRNGRLALLECKKKGGRSESGQATVAGNMRLHEIILGGAYGASFFAVASEDIRTAENWRRLGQEYELSGMVIGGAELLNLPARIQKELVYDPFNA